MTQYMSPKAVEDWLDNYISTIKEADVEIKTCFDFAWWFNYTNKLNHVIYRILIIYPNLAKYFDRVYPFYYTKDFLRWSIENHPEQKIGKSLGTYKKCAKQFIYQYTKDEDYLTKPKIGSLGEIWWQARGVSKVVAIDKNHKLLSLDEASLYVRKDNDD